jgi:hypothetical protein
MFKIEGTFDGQIPAAQKDRPVVVFTEPLIVAAYDVPESPCARTAGESTGSAGRRCVVNRRHRDEHDTSRCPVA